MSSLFALTCFFCVQQLEVLSIQKHGVAKALRNKKLEKQDNEAARQTLLRTYFLLHCGIFVDMYSLQHAQELCPDDLDPGWFAAEYYHVLERKGYRKPKDLNNQPARVNKHGTPYPQKLRSVEAFITDHHEKVVPHLHRYVEKDENGPARPFFHPARRPGSIIPQEKHLEAYVAVEKAVEAGLQAAGLPIIGRFCPIELVSPMQAYVLKPSAANMETVMKVLEEEKQKKEAKQARLQPPAANHRTTNAQPSIAVRSAPFASTSRPPAPIASTSNAAPSRNYEAIAAPFAEKSSPCAGNGDKEQIATVQPDYVPSPDQVAFEEETVRKQARWMKASEEEARKARMDRVNQVVRAASVAKLDPSANLEKLKWSLVYDKNEKQAPNASAISQVFTPPPAFGAHYVNAQSKAEMEKERKLMLKTLYMRELLRRPYFQTAIDLSFVAHA